MIPGFDEDDNDNDYDDSDVALREDPSFELHPNFGSLHLSATKRALWSL